MESRKEERRKNRLKAKKRKRRKSLALFLSILIIIGAALGIFWAGKKLRAYRDEKKREEDLAYERAKPVKGFSQQVLHFLETKEDGMLYKIPDDKAQSKEIKKGSYIAYYGTEGDFMKVKYNEDTGYMKKDLGKAIMDNSLFKVVSGQIIVNADYHLPESYDPGEDPEAMEAFLVMKEAIEREDGDMTLIIVSGYRPYSYDGRIPEGDQVRKTETDEIKHYAKKGHSEHQTGLAFDLMGRDKNARVNMKFKDQPEYKWLKENAYKFGFIERYPENSEEKTGYQYEPWHYRYVGVDLATDLHNKGLTMEEYFGL